MAFFQALIPIGHILIVVCIVWLVFAILGVQLWKGTFYSCNDPTVVLKEFCNGTFVDNGGAVVPRDWSSADVNFDNTGYVRAILSNITHTQNALLLIPISVGIPYTGACRYGGELAGSCVVSGGCCEHHTRTRALPQSCSSCVLYRLHDHRRLFCAESVHCCADGAIPQPGKAS